MRYHVCQLRLWRYLHMPQVQQQHSYKKVIKGFLDGLPPWPPWQESWGKYQLYLPWFPCNATVTTGCVCLVIPQFPFRITPWSWCECQRRSCPHFQILTNYFSNNYILGVPPSSTILCWFCILEPGILSPGFLASPENSIAYGSLQWRSLVPYRFRVYHLLLPHLEGFESGFSWVMVFR